MNPNKTKNKSTIKFNALCVLNDSNLKKVYSTQFQFELDQLYFKDYSSFECRDITGLSCILNKKNN